MRKTLHRATFAPVHAQFAQPAATPLRPLDVPPLALPAAEDDGSSSLSCTPTSPFATSPSFCSPERTPTTAALPPPPERTRSNSNRNSSSSTMHDGCRSCRTTKDRRASESGSVRARTPSSPFPGAAAAAAAAAAVAAARTSQGQQQHQQQPLSSRTQDATTAAASLAAEFDWNNRFIEALDEIGALTHNSHADERLRAYENLSRLAGDFNDTVRTYARIIVSEVYLPPEQKTIRPLAMGGIVGGDKYVVHGILFKFAVDTKKLYDSDEHAARVAGHELKGCVQIYNCWEPGVHFPMMTIVDYRGFRIVGMPLLPIDGTRTLVYGSNDAGRTIKTCAFLEARLRSIGEKLNLKPHLVGKEGVLFYTPIDLEGHLGTDGRYYLIDFSRLFPPQSLSPAHRMGHLYQLLRPEFVRMYFRPLCSDAFSSFTCPGHPDKVRRDMAEEHDDEIDEATDYLTGTVVQVFAQRLVSLPPEKRASFPLIMLLHESGINCRYLGLLYGYVSNMGDAYWSTVLLIEMVARVIKTEVRALLRRKMLELRHPGEFAYLDAVVLYLNLVLGSSDASDRHWAHSIVPGLVAKFPGFGDTPLAASLLWGADETKSTTTNRGSNSMATSTCAYAHRTQKGGGEGGAKGMSSCGASQQQQGRTELRLKSALVEGTNELGLRDARCLLLVRVSGMLGLHFSSDAWALLAHSAAAYDRKMSPVTSTDLQELRETVKEMNVASHSAGFVLKTKALLAAAGGEQRRLLELAVEQFNRALEGNPDNKVTLRNLGDCYVLLDRQDEALDAYARCIQADPEDPNTYYKFAIVLDKMGALDNAEELYLRSLERYPLHSNCCHAYADFLCYQRKNFREAEHFYLEAVDMDDANYAACNNYAIFLVTVQRDYARAGHYFRRALRGSPHNEVFTANYASYLFHIQRNTVDADAYAARARSLRGSLSAATVPLASSSSSQTGRLTSLGLSDSGVR